jgi:hypothetical protein
MNKSIINKLISVPKMINTHCFTGESDKVACFICDVGIHEWESKDEPLKEHLKHAPMCIFAQHVMKNSVSTE